MKRLHIHAPNIHHGGGGVLLCDLLKSVNMIPIQVLLVVDSRINLPEELPQSIIVKKINGTIFNRLFAEFSLKFKARKGDFVLCFGNLPPLFSLPSFVVTYVQNRFLIDSQSLGLLPIKIRMKIRLEKVWLRLFRFNSNQYFVQTSTMRSFLANSLGERVKISVSPFHASPLSNESFSNTYDFIYIASGESHKNHDILIKSWALLGKEGIFPSLALTLDEEKFPELVSNIRIQSKQLNLKIINLGALNRREIIGALKASSALVYPSKIESFGMPLIEAKDLDIPIIASELDYVWDVVLPKETFDPNSPLSISRAIKRFLKINAVQTKIKSPSDFLLDIVKLNH